jgi:hypothetical protein
VRLVLRPGAYNRAPAWRSRTHWLDVVLPAAVDHGRVVLRRHRIAPDTFARVMTAHAAHADDDTGRGAVPTVEHIQELARCSERTVQRARAAARELGIGVEVFRGRHLTLDERIGAYDAGQTHRGWASVYALGCPLWLAHRLRLPLAEGYPQLNARGVHGVGERGTPPVGNPSRSTDREISGGSSAQRADERAARAASTREVGPGRCPARFNPHGLALARGLQRRVSWVAGVHPGRLAPALTRFATAPVPWTAEQLVAAVDRMLAGRGWSVAAERVRHPAPMLARLLRDLDHLDQLSTRPEPGPGVPTTQESLSRLREVQRSEAAERDGRARLCEHGVAGADPETGRASRCAFCRRG